MSVFVYFSLCLYCSGGLVDGCFDVIKVKMKFDLVGLGKFGFVIDFILSLEL